MKNSSFFQNVVYVLTPIQMYGWDVPIKIQMYGWYVPIKIRLKT